MNRERFLEILEAYGAHEHAWPVEERGAAKAYLAAHEEAQVALRAARDLDIALDAFQPAIPDLSEGILAAVGESAVERFLRWLFPGGNASVLRPALLGCLPLLFGAVLGFSLPAPTDSSAIGWEDQERLLVSAGEEEYWYE